MDKIKVSPTPYLSLASVIVRQATRWQAPEGWIGDPYNPPERPESQTATARYCAAIGHLVAADWLADLLPAAVRALDWACQEIAEYQRRGEKPPASPFKIKDIMILYGALMAPTLPPRLAAKAHDQHIDLRAKQAAWAAALTFVPDRIYIGERNWLFYAAAAETLRVHYGLSHGWDYVDEILESQMPYWTAEGLYRDPHDPTTYDLTVRQALALMLHYGYAGRYQEWMREVLRRGALTTLQFMSPCAVAPYGGRSNQFHIMEAMIAYFAEWQAREEAQRGELVLARRLRGLALSCAAAVGRWIYQDPYRSLKHNMSKEQGYGYDNYGHSLHSVYGLLAANLFAGAYHVADAQLPYDLHWEGDESRWLYLRDAFYRIFASVGDLHIQIDTRGQAGYDATGLGRFHRRDVPIETALNMSCVSSPSYRLPQSAPRAVALGPGWPHGPGWRYLAEADRESHSVEVVLRQRSADQIAFSLLYRFHQPEAWGVSEVREHYQLTREKLAVQIDVPGAAKLRLQVPLIATDGEAESEIQLSSQAAQAVYRGHTFRVRIVEPAQSFLEPWLAPNRNGLYRVAIFETPGERVCYEASLA